MAEIGAYVALGANLDDPVMQIECAFTELGQLPATRMTARSSLYLSRPTGHLDQPDFVNAAAGLMTRLAPRVLLELLLGIEARHGRSRSFRNAPRTLDLDLLLYDGLVMHEPGLTLPHPRMMERAFVLVPLTEIDAEILVPGRGRAADALSLLDQSGMACLPDPARRAVN